jgi:hypothetical protein
VTTSFRNDRPAAAAAFDGVLDRAILDHEPVPAARLWLPPVRHRSRRRARRARKPEGERSPRRTIAKAVPHPLFELEPEVLDVEGEVPRRRRRRGTGRWPSSDLSEGDLLRALPQELLPQLAQVLVARGDRGEVVPRQLPAFEAKLT